MTCRIASTASAGGSGPRALHAVFQRPAREQLHRDHRRAGDFLAAEDVDAVGMSDGGGELALAQESRAVLRTGQPLIQDLERHAAALLDVLGLVDFAHAATPEQPADAIGAEHLARREA